jgi:hypothetical protein
MTLWEIELTTFRLVAMPQPTMIPSAPIISLVQGWTSPVHNWKVYILTTGYIVFRWYHARGTFVLELKMVGMADMKHRHDPRWHIMSSIIPDLICLSPTRIKAKIATSID